MASKRLMRWMTGAALTLALAGAGAIAWGGTASAQTVTPPAAAATPVPGSTTPGAPAPNGAPNGAPFGGMHGGGRGGGGPGMGMDGPGPGGKGAVTTADGAATAISSTTEYITLVKSDLTYATGKMDTSQVEGWLSAADKLLGQAQSASTAGQYGQAGAYAQAARAVAQTADLVMQQTLGASTLPSASSQPAGRGDGMRGPQDQTGTATAPPQAQVSRELQRTYNSIVSQGAVIGANAEAKSYLTQAQDAYKTAYTAYGAGDYQAAHNAARLAESLLRVADSLLHVSDAGVSPDAPVNVPAPSF